MNLSEDMRRALGLAVQILEELPDELLPYSNIEDMKGLLAGQSSGRDGWIVTEAVATALAYLTHRSITIPPMSDGNDRELSVQRMNTRVHEFAALFELVRQVEAYTFSASYLQSCDRLAVKR
jgi:hypothetical protein